MRSRGAGWGRGAVDKGAGLAQGGGEAAAGGGFSIAPNRLLRRLPHPLRILPAGEVTC